MSPIGRTVAAMFRGAIGHSDNSGVYSDLLNLPSLWVARADGTGARELLAPSSRAADFTVRFVSFDRLPLR